METDFETPDVFMENDLGTDYIKVPPGIYNCRLTSVDISRAGGMEQADAIKPRFTIIDKGDYEREDILAFRSTAVYPSKPGKNGEKRPPFAPGMQQIKTDIINSGAKFPASGLPRDVDKLARIYQDALGGKALTVKLYIETYQEKDQFGKPTGEMKEARKAMVMRREGVAAAAPSAPSRADLGLA